MTGMLAGKNLLITGVITEASMAFHTARMAQEQGATVVLTGYGRLSLVERIAKRLPEPAPVVELDVTDQAPPGFAGRLGSANTSPASTACCTRSASRRPTALGGDFLATAWEDVATTVHTSAYSLKALAVASLPLMSRGGSHRRAGLRRPAGLAGLQLDGCGQGRAGVGVPLPGPRSRSATGSGST